MRLIFHLISLVFSHFLAESQGAITRHKYDGSNYRNHLSNIRTIYETFFSQDHLTHQFTKFVDFVLKNDLGDRKDANPIHFNDDLQNGDLLDDSDDGKGNSSKKIAECFVCHEEDGSMVSQKFYMPLRDATLFAKNFKFLASEEHAFKVLNLDKSDAELADQLSKMQIKCKPVLANEVVDECKACVYFEEMVFRRHFRYGHFLNCGVLECMNGYDEKLRDSYKNGYFVYDKVKYHPICIT